MVASPRGAWSLSSPPPRPTRRRRTSPGVLPPGWITPGPDGALWFTAGASPSSVIGRITTGGQITEFPLPAGHTAACITTGADGNLWFTDSAQNKIGRMTTGGAITEWRVPTVRSGLSGIAASPKGTHFVAFAEAYGNQIGLFQLA